MKTLYKILFENENNIDNNKSDMYIYHITLLSNITSIQNSGLQAGGSDKFGGGYSSYSAGKIFFTELAGVDWWFDRIKQTVIGGSEEPTVWHTPVCLRVKKDKLDLRVDEVGSRDSLHNAYYVKTPIIPSEIEIWNFDWIPIAEVDADEMSDTVYELSQFIIDWDDGTAENISYQEWLNRGYDEISPEALYNDSDMEYEQSNTVESSYWDFNYEIYNPHE